jgi:hypothetical protein
MIVSFQENATPMDSVHSCLQRKMDLLVIQCLMASASKEFVMPALVVATSVLRMHCVQWPVDIAVETELCIFTHQLEDQCLRKRLVLR